MALRVEALSFLFPVPTLSSSLASSHSRAPIAAALPFTFIRWCHCRGQLWIALSEKGEAWIPFDLSVILGQTGGPTQRQVGSMARVLREGKRGSKDNNGREAASGRALNMKCRCDDSAIGRMMGK